MKKLSASSESIISKQTNCQIGRTGNRQLWNFLTLKLCVCANDTTSCHIFFTNFRNATPKCQLLCRVTTTIASVMLSLDCLLPPSSIILQHHSFSLIHITIVVHNTMGKSFVFVQKLVMDPSLFLLLVWCLSKTQITLPGSSKCVHFTASASIVHCSLTEVRWYLLPNCWSNTPKLSSL